MGVLATTPGPGGAGGKAGSSRSTFELISEVLRSPRILNLWKAAEWRAREQAERILTPLADCVLSVLLNLTLPQFPHWKMGITQ